MFPVPRKGPGNVFTTAQVAAWNAAGTQALLRERPAAPTRAGRQRATVKNTTGAAVAVGAVAALSATYQTDPNTVTTAKLSEPMLAAIAATSSSRLSTVCVFLEPAGSNQWARVATGGIVNATVDIQHASDTVAVYDTGARKFKSAISGGFVIVAKPAGTGDKTCAVNLSKVDLECIGKPDADIAAGASGTISVWRAGADTTRNITPVYYDWMDGDGEQISTGKECLCQYFDDEQKWRIIGAECEDPAAAPGIILGSPAIYSADLGYPPKSNHTVDVPDAAFTAATMALAQQWGDNLTKPGYGAAEPAAIVIQPYDGGYFLYIHTLDPAAKIGGEFNYILAHT